MAERGSGFLTVVFGRALAGSLVCSLLGVTGSSLALAGTLPEGMTKFDFNMGQASSDKLWYQPSTTRPDGINNPEPDEIFQDQQFELGATRGINERTEVGFSVGFTNKGHLRADGSDIYRTTGISYYTLRAKRGIYTSEERGFDLTGTFELKLAHNVNEPWVFQSPNDRSHHGSIGFEMGRNLFGNVYGYVNPKYIYRTNGRVSQWEGAAGLVMPVSARLMFSPYYHFLQSADGTNCFHDPKLPTQFHELPYGPKLSDSHSGPGAVVSYAAAERVSVDAFTYVKLAGMNTDKSTTLGVNLSYLMY